MRVALLFACLLLACAGAAEVLDRVVVVMDFHVILDSEVRRDIRLTSFLNNEPPNFSGPERRKAAERLIERRMIEREMALNRYQPPEPAEVDGLLAKLQSRYKTPAEFQRALKEADITQEDVRASLQSQALILRFVEVRFRPAIQVTDEEIKDYYNEQFLPAVKRRGPGPPPTMEQARPEIEELLAQSLVDNALDRWLNETRTQMRIRIQKEAVQ